MILPGQVHDVIGRHLIRDGYDFVLDTDASRGSWLVDAVTGDRFLDMFSMYASAPLGLNHPALTDDEMVARLGRVAVNKPANGDVYTTYLAGFVQTFERVLGDPALPRLFLISGGALAVENALKAAFDWKQQHNEANGRPPERGTQVLHLRGAFHGRSGYTLSLTNTEPVKTARFPKFDWPRIDTPAVRFPVEDHLDDLQTAEERSLEQAAAAFEANPHDIACFIAEPILSEGGDHHLRGEYLRAIHELCREHDALFVMDEVQTGGGATGEPWGYQALGLEPDLVAFGKKLQTCGVMAGGRLDEVPDNVFTISSRINSTWGGNLVDMVRATRILEVIEEEDLIARAATVGKHLVGLLHGLRDDHPDLVSNPRGRGLLAAFDLPDQATRDELRRRLEREERVLMLGCGDTGMRFRPALTVSEEELSMAITAIDRVLSNRSTS